MTAFRRKTLYADGAEYRASRSRETLASLVGISPRQFERMWLKHFDMGPSQFYLGVRLKAAQKLLHESTFSIFDIAMQCGFASASHLGRCYRKLFDATPGQERAARASRRSPLRKRQRSGSTCCEPVEASNATVVSRGCVEGSGARGVQSMRPLIVHERPCIFSDLHADARPSARTRACARSRGGTRGRCRIQIDSSIDAVCFVIGPRRGRA